MLLAPTLSAGRHDGPNVVQQGGSPRGGACLVGCGRRYRGHRRGARLLGMHRMAMAAYLV